LLYPNQVFQTIFWIVGTPTCAPYLEYAVKDHNQIF